MYSKIVIICLFVVVFSFKAKAQIEDTAIFNTVVVTGEIKPTESSKSVQNVRIITLKTIERQVAVYLGVLLSKELNV
ncbi:MAG: hypothetical protein WD512_01765 [Candidatus Paceibacterota bacterium]